MPRVVTEFLAERIEQRNILVKLSATVSNRSWLTRHCPNAVLGQRFLVPASKHAIPRCF